MTLPLTLQPRLGAFAHPDDDAVVQDHAVLGVEVVVAVFAVFDDFGAQPAVVGHVYRFEVVADRFDVAQKFIDLR